MKRLLPLVACAVCYTAFAIEPAEMPDFCLQGVSANGLWTAGSNESTGTFVIINLENGEEYWYGPETYDPTRYTGGLGKFVSDNGVVVGNYYDTDQPCYWEDEQWHPLPIRNTDYGAFPNAITPDGSRITGSVSKIAMSLDATEVMNVPVIWNRNAKGTYDMYVELPYPTTDWTGRTPQYVLVDDISADGKVLAGNMVDYSGFTQQPLVFTEDEKGEWTYTLLHPELTNPDNIKFPEFPGEAPEEPDPVSYMTPANAATYTEKLEAWEMRPMPEQFDYMTDAEYIAYIEAMEAFYEDSETNPYPMIEDFMTADEYQAYLDAINAYYDTPAPDPMDYMSEYERELYVTAQCDWENDFATWLLEYNAFDEVFWDAVVNPNAMTYVMNSARISYNGRYYMMGTEAYYLDPTSPMGMTYASTPIIFDLEDGTYTLLEKGENDILATMVLDNGGVLGGTPSNNQTRLAAISPAAGEPFVLLSEVLKEKAPDTYNWVVDNMTQDVMNFDYVYDIETDTYEEVITVETKVVTGTPVASRDMSTIVTWAYNVWDWEGPEYISYVLPLNLGTVGINAVSTDAGVCKAHLDRDGRLTLSNGVVNATIYDINGREVYRGTASATTGLNRGVYIVKATTADGKTHTTKSAILK